MWTYVDFWLAAFGGFAGGYLMALGSYWLEAITGTIRLDFGITGMKYVGGELPGWWVIGNVFHLIDSVLLGVAYGALARPWLGALGFPLYSVWGNVLAGMAYGVVLWFFLAMLIAMPMMGEGVFAYRSRSARTAVLVLGLHFVYGGLLGLIYIP